VAYTCSFDPYLHRSVVPTVGARQFFLLISASNTRLSSDLALDEGEGLVSVDADVLLVVVGVVSVAAVWVLGVAVALDDACVGGRAGES
jgi:hypothetical protein